MFLPYKNIDIWPVAKLWAKLGVPIFGISALAITLPLFGQLGCNFYGRSGDYYLSIFHDKSKERCLVSIYDYWAT